MRSSATPLQALAPTVAATYVRLSLPPLWMLSTAALMGVTWIVFGVAKLGALACMLAMISALLLSSADRRAWPIKRHVATPAFVIVAALGAELGNRYLQSSLLQTMILAASVVYAWHAARFLRSIAINAVRVSTFIRTAHDHELLERLEPSLAELITTSSIHRPFDWNTPSIRRKILWIALQAISERRHTSQSLKA